MKFEKLKKIIGNLSLRRKLFLSYAVIGIIPFIIFSVYIIHLTNNQLRTSAKNNFDSVYYNCRVNLQKNIEKVENIINLIAADEKIAGILNSEYDSYYQKYVDITEDLDSVIDTVMFTNPELSRIDFYVNDTLAFIRENFHPLNLLEEKSSGFRFDSENQLQWVYRDEKFSVYRKIYSPFKYTEFAVIEVTVPKKVLLNPQIFAEMPYKLSLGGEVVINTAVLPSERYADKTETVGTQGILTGYMEKGYNIKEMQKNLWIIGIEITLAFALLIWGINRFADWFTYRIHVINRALARTVSNNFSITLEEKYHDEIGELIAYINRMIRDTRKMIHDVYESKIKQREYEMKALQAQINPHFLYNTLSAINWHAMTTENTAISEIVTALSRFYRTALNLGNNVTTVEKELENIRAYVQIQLSIHNYSFDVEYEIDEAVRSFKMPNLILQPIVENAIEHGLDLKADGKGKLTIRAWKEKKFVYFEISDNGPGIPPEKMENLLSQTSKSYGLRNVNKRLQLFYGENYQIEYFSEEGTTFRLKLKEE